jgi:hypothetical protein
MPHGERPHFSRAAGPGKIHPPDQGRQLVSFTGGFPVADSESPFGLCLAKAISALLWLWESVADAVGRSAGTAPGFPHSWRKRKKR